MANMINVFENIKRIPKPIVFKNEINTLLEATM